MFVKWLILVHFIVLLFCFPFSYKFMLLWSECFWIIICVLNCWLFKYTLRLVLSLKLRLVDFTIINICIVINCFHHFLIRILNNFTIVLIFTLKLFYLPFFSINTVICTYIMHAFIISIHCGLIMLLNVEVILFIFSLTNKIMINYHVWLVNFINFLF